MSLRYNKIKKNPTIFNRLFGMSPQQFEEILRKVERRWQKKVIGAYKRPGRDYKLDVSDMLLMLLLYYRSYITQIFVGYIFGIDDSRVCRIIKTMESIMPDIMKLSIEHKLTKGEVEELIIDATEQPIERPKNDQKAYYSGKKKRHTVKTEIRINLEGKILHVSEEKPGSTHDFNLFKQGPPLPENAHVYVDSGYQGIGEFHSNYDLPYKSSKSKKLGPEEKEYNTALSRVRIRVENVLGDIKTFKILSDRYRNKRKRYNVKFKIIAGIVNMKNGFQLA